MKIIAIYDNGGKTIDRYSIITNIRSNNNMGSRLYDSLGCDDCGGKDFSQWGDAWYNHDGQNRHLGRKVNFTDLNEATQTHIAERLFGKDE